MFELGLNIINICYFIIYLIRTTEHKLITKVIEVNPTFIENKLCSEKLHDILGTVVQ